MSVTRSTFDEVMVPCYNPLPMVITHGEGSYLFDSNDHAYLDFTSGIAVNCLGHHHKKVCKIIKKQSKKLLHVSNIFVNDKTLTLAQKLVQKTPFTKVFFQNSGAEANEAALKLARRRAYDLYGEDKYEIISFLHGFHGRTLFSVNVGGQEKYVKGFGPKIDGVTHLPFNDIQALKNAISDKTCAIMLELIQGEGGILPVDPDFLQEVVKLAHEHNALVIVDEVQTGVGRCGTFYAFEQFGFTPDIMTSAKGLGAGLPIGAVLTTDDIAKHFSVGTHGSTFGGNPLACAVGSYVVDTISDPQFLAEVRRKGEILKKGLEDISERYSCFKEVRGRGLLVGAELTGKYENNGAVIQKLCAENDLFILLAGGNVLRLAPPLNISEEDLNLGIQRLAMAIASFAPEAQHK